MIRHRAQKNGRKTVLREEGEEKTQITFRLSEPKSTLSRNEGQSVLNERVLLKEVAQAHLDARVGFLFAPSSSSVAFANGFHKTTDSRLCEDNRYTGPLPCGVVDIVAASS